MEKRRPCSAPQRMMEIKFNAIQYNTLLSKKLGKNLVIINALNIQYGDEYFRLSTKGNTSLLTWGS